MTAGRNTRTLTAMLVAIVFHAAAAHASASLSVADNIPPISPGGLFSIPVVIASGSDGDFRLRVASTEGLTLISKAEAIHVPAGSEVKRLLNFVTSQSLSDENAEVTITLESVATGREEATVKRELGIALQTCATIKGVPESVNIQPPRKHSVFLKIENCAGSRADYDISVSGASDLNFELSRQKVNIPSGGTAPVTLSLSAPESSSAQPKVVTISLTHRGRKVAEKQVNVNLIVPLVRQQANAKKFIPLIFNLEYRAYPTGVNKTSLNLVVPMFKDGGYSFKSNLNVSADESQVDVRQQSYVLGTDTNLLSIGNQSMDLPRFVKRNSASFSGVSLRHLFGNSSVTFFSGSHNLMDSKFLKLGLFEKKNLSFSYSRIKESLNEASFSGIESDVLSAALYTRGGMNVGAEFIRGEKQLAGAQGSVAGKGFSLSADYRKSNMYFSANFRASSPSLATVDGQNGTDLSARYVTGKFTLNAGYQNKTYYKASADEAVFTTFIPALSQSAFYGLNYRSPKSKLSVSLTAVSENRSGADYAFGTQPVSAGKSAMKIKLVKQMDSFEAVLGAEQGRKDANGNSSGYRMYDVGGKYDIGRFRLSTSLTSLMDFEDSANGYLSKRTFSAAVRYLSSNKRMFIETGFHREIGGYAVKSESSRSFFSIKYGLSKEDKIGFSVDSIRSAGIRENRFSAVYTKNFTVKIPYKKLATVRGIVFEDGNLNGVYDSTDTPIPNIIVKLTGGYIAITNRGGLYTIADVDEGDRVIETSEISHPSGLGLVNGMDMSLKVKPGFEMTMDIPLQKMFVLKGNVGIDPGNVFNSIEKLSPGDRRISLLKGGEPVDEAFSNRDGDYYFENLKPGVYCVAIDTEWLPSNVVVKGPPMISLAVGEDNPEVDGCSSSKSAVQQPPQSDDTAREEAMRRVCGINDTCQDLDFMISLKTKKIIRTLSK